MKKREQDRDGFFGQNNKRSFIRWFLIVLVGIFCALLGVGIHMATYTLLNLKNSIVTSYMYTGRWGEAFLYHFFMTLFFAFLAYACVFYEKGAMSSGIPEVTR